MTRSGDHMIDNRYRLREAGTVSHPLQLDLFGRDAVASRSAGPFPTAGGPDTSQHGLYGLCHDIRTALNAILGFSEIMTQKLHGPLGHPKYDEYAQHVRFSGQALLSVSDQVLTTLADQRANARIA